MLILLLPRVRVEDRVVPVSWWSRRVRRWIMNGIWTLRNGTSASSHISFLPCFTHFLARGYYCKRGVIKALNASTFGAPSTQNQNQNQTTANASAGASALAGPSSSVSSSSSYGGLGLSSTFTHFRSQLHLPPHVQPQPQPQPDQLESASSASGREPARGVGGPAVEGGAAQASTGSGGGGDGASTTNASATSDGGGQSQGGITRDSLYDMADRFSAWPSEKIEKAKRLRDQFLSKV